MVPTLCVCKRNGLKNFKKFYLPRAGIYSSRNLVVGRVINVYQSLDSKTQRDKYRKLNPFRFSTPYPTPI